MDSGRSVILVIQLKLDRYFVEHMPPRRPNSLLKLKLHTLMVIYSLNVQVFILRHIFLRKKTPSHIKNI